MIAALGNHLWQCSLFALAAALIALLLRSYSAKVRFWIWFSASVKFALPFSLLITFGARTASVPARIVVDDSWASPAIHLAQPLAPQSIVVSPDFDYNAIALAIWLVGALLLARKRWREWLFLRSAVRSSTPAPIDAEVEIRYCPGLLEPLIVGWRRPILLLPARITAVLSRQQLDAVLAHELCHARRHDNVLASFHMLVELLFWFHPVVWWIGARLLAERERACDEEVLRRGAEPRAYAEGILAVCRRYAHSPLAASGVAGGT